VGRVWWLKVFVKYFDPTGFLLEHAPVCVSGAMSAPDFLLQLRHSTRLALSSLIALRLRFRC
jgi:hypothetical protein